jgi:integrase/recombinase XerD
MCASGAIVKTCGSRSLGGFRLGVLAGSFDQFPVDEGRSGADQGDEVRRVDRAPPVLCGLDELESHGQPGGPRARAPW